MVDMARVLMDYAPSHKRQFIANEKDHTRLELTISFL